MSANQRTIVVGVDASSDADEALQWARRTAAEDDRIVLVHAWDVPTLVGVDSMVVIEPERISSLAEQGLAELVERQHDDRLVGVTREGHAGRAIIAEADERDADMIVVGHRGSGLAGVVLGSTASYAIHHTERPVVVVRGEHQDEPQRIVVGADDHDLDEAGENESVRALQFAYRMPGVRRIDVLHSWFVPSMVVGPWSNPGADFEEMDAAAVAIAQHVIDAAGPAPDGVTVTAKPGNGTPEFALIEESLEADLVVVGSRGRGGFAGLILGSTSLDLASHSHSPVAIVR